MKAVLPGAPSRVKGTAALAFAGVTSTASGVSFDPSADVWEYRDGVNNVYLDFTSLSAASQELVASSKAALAWYAANRSPDHLTNLFRRLQHFVRFTMAAGRLLATITSTELINYKATLDGATEWYLSSLAVLLKKWHRLGYEGVEPDAILLLKQLRLKGNQKGVAVLTMDPEDGPFSYIELEALQTALNTAYADGKSDTSSFVLAWLYVLLGQRNKQHAALKVCDVRVARGEAGAQSYSLMMPSAKKRSHNPRATFVERPVVEQFGEILVAYSEGVRREFESILPDASQAPLFPSRFGTRWSLGFEFHHSADDIGNVLTTTLENLSVTSERTGRPLRITGQRFRRTIGTRAAEEGYGPLIIARLLDHTDTQNVGVYSANSPAIIDRLDRAIAMEMAPLAQAFAGVIADGSQSGRDPSRHIIDLRIDQSGNSMGGCGRHGFCGFNAPIACYTCKSFEAWLDGPHEAVLNHLVGKRDQLLKTSDKRIASVNDRTILAVAAVIQRCEEIKSQQQRGSLG